MINRGFKISTRYQPIFVIWLLLLLNIFPAFCYQTDSLQYTSKSDVSDSVFSKPDSLVTDSVSIGTDSLNIGKSDSTTAKKKNDIEDPVKYSSRDSLFFDIENKTVHLYGDAHVTYQKIDLKASYIEFNMADQTVYATGVPDSTGTNTGNPVFQDGEEKFDAHWIRYNFKSRKGFVYFVKTQQGEGTLVGDSTKRSPDGQISLNGATYSTCDLDHPHFYFRLTKAKAVPKDKIVSSYAYLVVADIPFKMLFIPFGYFPSTQTYSSGILFPSWGEEKERGFYLRDGGYYFAISDYMDARITGEFFSKGSWGTAVQTNYKKRYKFSGNLSFNYNENVNSEKGLPDYATKQDYRFVWHHSQDNKANPNSTFSASVNMSSSSYDKRNSYSIPEYITITKTSSISYSHNWPNTPFSFTGSLNHNQNSQTKEVEMTLPQMALNMNTIYPLRRKEPVGEMKWYEDISLKYDAAAENRINTTDSLFLTNNMFDNMQNGFRHSIQPSYVIKVTKSINITPSLNYKGVAYTEYNTYQWNDSLVNPNTGLQGMVDTIRHPGLVYAHAYYPSIGTGYSPKLYGMYMFRSSKVKAIRHMMSPSAIFNFIPDVSDYMPNYYYKYYDNGHEKQTSKFAQNIYGSPSPAPGKSARIDLALKNNFEMKYTSENDTSSEEKKISLLRDLNFGTSYNLMADSFQLELISMNSSTSVFDDKLEIQFNAAFDPYKFDTSGRGKRVNSYMINGLNKPARLTRASISLSTNFSSSEIKDDKKAKPDNTGSDQTIDGPANINNNEVDYSLPWSLNVSYSWSYTNYNPKEKSIITQSMQFSGDLSLTKKWKLGFTSGYDFTAKDLTPTAINISRDLHCWQMTFSFVPFGDRQSYNFNINARAAILKDLKYNKRNEEWRGKF